MPSAPFTRSVTATVKFSTIVPPFVERSAAFSTRCPDMAAVLTDTIRSLLSIGSDVHSPVAALAAPPKREENNSRKACRNRSSLYLNTQYSDFGGDMVAVMVAIRKQAESS